MMSAHLLFLSGSRSGEAVPLTGSATTIGRERDVDLVLSSDDETDVQASGVHATLERDGDRYFVRDRDSRYGTFVNGRRIEGRRVLTDGDVIEFGLGGAKAQFSSGAQVAVDGRGLPLQPSRVDRFRRIVWMAGGAVTLGLIALGLYPTWVVEQTRRESERALQDIRSRAQASWAGSGTYPEYQVERDAQGLREIRSIKQDSLERVRRELSELQRPTIPSFDEDTLLEADRVGYDARIDELRAREEELRNQVDDLRRQEDRLALLSEHHDATLTLLTVVQARSANGKEVRYIGSVWSTGFVVGREFVVTAKRAVQPRKFATLYPRLACESDYWEGRGWSVHGSYYAWLAGSPMTLEGPFDIGSSRLEGADFQSSQRSRADGIHLNRTLPDSWESRPVRRSCRPAGSDGAAHDFTTQTHALRSTSDFAVLRLSQPASRSFLLPVDNRELSGSVRIVVSRQVDGAGVLRSAAGGVFRVENGVAVHDVRTVPGDVGAPALNRRVELVGMHLSQLDRRFGILISIDAARGLIPPRVVGEVQAPSASGHSDEEDQTGR